MSDKAGMRLAGLNHSATLPRTLCMLSSVKKRKNETPKILQKHNDKKSPCLFRLLMSHYITSFWVAFAKMIHASRHV